MTRMPNLVTVDADDTLWNAAKKLVEHEDRFPSCGQTDFSTMDMKGWR